MTQPLELSVTKIIPAPAKTIFEAWLDPKALAQFIKPMEGMPDCTVEVDAKVGGGFLIVMKAGEKDLPHRGEYKTIQRYEELAFTWISENTIPDSTVTLTFKERAPRETEVTLHHTGFPNDESRENHQGGWNSILEHLSRFVA